MKKKIEESLGCLWVIGGFFLLIYAIMWLDENSAKLGCVKSGLFFGVIFLSLIIYRTRIDEMRGRETRQTDSSYMSRGKKKKTSVKSVDGKRITISRLSSYKPRKDRIAKRCYAPEAIEIIKKGWYFILDEEFISMLDKNGEGVYTLRYDQISQITAVCGAIKGGGAKDMLPFPSWAHEFGDESIAIIVERAGLEMAKRKMYRKFKSRSIGTKYYILPPKSLPPESEKIVEEKKTIFKRLPAYNPDRDRNFNARGTNHNGWELIVNVMTISLLDAEENKLYQVEYSDITSLREHYIWANQMKFPVPAWARRLDKTLEETIIKRANLVKIKTTKIIGERTTGGMIDREIETFYYGRKAT